MDPLMHPEIHLSRCSTRRRRNQLVGMPNADPAATVASTASFAASTAKPAATAAKPAAADPAGASASALVEEV